MSIRRAFSGQSGLMDLVLPLVRFGLAVTYFLALLVWEIMELYWTDPFALALGIMTLLYLGLILGAYLKRGPDEPIGRSGWTAKVIALCGANLLIPLSMLPVESALLEEIAVAFSLAGLALSLWAVWHLRRVFSIVPEARRLVQTGPYRLVRHPLYLAGFLIGLGLLTARMSPAALGLFAGFAYCQVLRMAEEESLLCRHVPEYRDYRQRTRALVPYVF